MSATRAAIAKALNVSERMMDMAAKVMRDGIPELEQAVMAGELKMWPAYLLADEPHDRQREILATVPPRKIGAYLKAERQPVTANLRHEPACTRCHGSGFEPTEAVAA